jgi:hypothetical protein
MKSTSPVWTLSLTILRIRKKAASNMLAMAMCGRTQMAAEVEEG